MHRHRGDALARARLADDAERLAGLDLEADAVDRADGARRRELDDQRLDLQQRPVRAVRFVTESRCDLPA